MRYFDPKRPGEKRTLTFEFATELPSSATIASVGTTTVSVHRGTDAAPSNILNGAAAKSGTDVLQSVQGGVSDVDYLVVAECTLSDGQILQLPAVLPVRNDF